MGYRGWYKYLYALPSGVVMDCCLFNYVNNELKGNENWCETIWAWSIDICYLRFESTLSVAWCTKIVDHFQEFSLSCCSLLNDPTFLSLMESVWILRLSMSWITNHKINNKSGIWGMWKALLNKEDNCVRLRRIRWY